MLRLRLLACWLSLTLTPDLASAEASARFDDVENQSPKQTVPLAEPVGRAPTHAALPALAEPASRECPRSAERVARARRLLAEQRALFAMGELSRTISEDPGCGSAYLELARLRGALGDYTEAELLYARAMKLSAVAEEALEARALMRRRQGKTREALLDLEAHVALAPGSIERLEALATVYIEVKAWAAALATYRRILSLDEGASRSELSAGLRIKVRALSLLAADADPVSAGASEDRSWERRAMAHFARN